ncbi:MAG: hypothetical protein RLN76_03205 [Phycisphaeraceae bacterium]
MKPSQRIEFVIGASHLQHLLDKIDQAGAPGWTVIHHVMGRGGRGIQSADELSGTSSNAYVIVAAPSDKTKTIVDAAQPILARAGGLCLISDCQHVQHHPKET